MTGHLGYESTGLNALRGQNNVQGLNDSGANPTYLPGYQPVDDPEIRAKFADAWGVEVPTTPGYRLDQMMSGLHDGRMKALYLIGENPAQTEPNAHHVEEGLGQARLPDLAGHLPNDMTREARGRRLPGLELRGEGRARSRTPSGAISRVREAAPLPGEARGDREIVISMAKALGCDWPEYPDAEAVWNELADLAPNWYGVRYDRLEENGIQWPVHGDRRPRTRSSCTRPHPRAPAAEASSSPSSTSGRSRSPTPSTRSCSPPAARSITTTRRR